MIKHILIPVDDDAGSQRAIEQGVALARACGARITAFHAMQEFTPLGIVDELLEPPPAELQYLARARAETLFRPLVGAATQAGVVHATLAVPGVRPWQAIIAAAEQRGCDLIVMASHGRRGLARFVLGSQTREVLDHATVSVLVVR